jgi:serine protease Do
MKLVTAALFALAASTAVSAQSVESALMLAGSGSAIGVSARDIEPSERERLQVQGGALVEEVRPDTPAAQAGLQASDVVVEFDGERVRSARQFSRLVQETPPGRPVEMRVVREGRPRGLTITPGAQSPDVLFNRPERERLRGAIERLAEIPFTLDLDLPSAAGGRGNRLGVAVEELSPQLASYFGAKDGVLVSSVADASPAARAGLKAGDVITSVNGQSITSPAALARALRGPAAETEVKIGIVRDKQPVEVTATPERPSRRPVRRIRALRGARPV